MLCIDGIDSSQDELIDGGTHFVLDLHHSLFLSWRRIRFATSQKGKHDVFAEFFGGSEDTVVRKVGHGEEFGKIVLHGRTREQDSSLDGQGIEGPTGLVVAVLEAMGFVTDQQIATVLVFCETTHVGSQALVAADQDLEDRGLGKGFQVFLDFFAIRFGKGEGLDSPGAQPLDEFVVPVLDERAGTYDNHTLGGGFLVGRDSCFEECVNQSHGLEGLSEPHVIGKDAPLSTVVLHPHDTLIHKIDTLPLMRSQPLGKNWRNKNILRTVFLFRSRFENRHGFFYPVFVGLDLGDPVQNA